MPIHILKLLDLREVAKGTIEFSFSKPAGLNFVPGQYAGFTLLHPTETDKNGITRRFSLASMPDDATINIVTRMQDTPYKRALRDFTVGSEIKFAGPTGTFTLHKDSDTPAVMIAGGIGIAPFYSMIKHEAAHPTGMHIQLFYGNQIQEEAAYLQALLAIQKQNPHFTCVPALAKPGPDWEFETGFITENLIKKHVKDIHKPIYYICGSPAMVTALQETLAEMGIDEDRIKVEDFPGY